MDRHLPAPEEPSPLPLNLATFVANDNLLIPALPEAGEPQQLLTPLEALDDASFEARRIGFHDEKNDPEVAIMALPRADAPGKAPPSDLHWLYEVWIQAVQAVLNADAQTTEQEMRDLEFHRMEAQEAFRTRAAQEGYNPRFLRAL